MSRSPEQIEAAREKANAVREEQRALLRAVKSGEVSLATLLRGELPHCLRRVQVHKLLTTFPRYPEKRFLRVMDTADAEFARELGEMTPRQLEIVARDLDAWELAHRVAGKAAA